jgi:hypothetical protein
MSLSKTIGFALLEILLAGAILLTISLSVMKLGTRYWHCDMPAVIQ